MLLSLSLGAGTRASVHHHRLLTEIAGTTTTDIVVDVVAPPAPLLFDST